MCAMDENQSNDLKELEVAVDRRISSNETWSSDVALTGGVIIESGVTLSILDCNVTCQYPSISYLVTVRGHLLAVNASFQGGDMPIMSSYGDVELTGCDLNLGPGSGGAIEGGRLHLEDTVINGGHGWNVNGSDVTLIDCAFTDQSGDWKLSYSALHISGAEFRGGTGTFLIGSYGSILDSTWTGTEMGLSIDRCGPLTLRDLTLDGNGIDIGIDGDGPEHFQHEVANVTLTHGNLTLVRGATGGVLEALNGSLYLVECQGVLVKGSYFRGSQHGLGMIGCTGMEVMGNSLEGCAVGLLSIDSQALVWSNDLLGNGEQVMSSGSDLVFGRDYPIGGNHWSDLETLDLMGGEGQDLPGPDGMADSPYQSVAAFDRYPKVHNCSLVNDVPEAEFGMSVSLSDRLTPIVFTYAGSSGSGLANLTWDMGDGSSAYGERVSYTYGLLGTFQVTLTVTDHKGSVDDVSHEVQIVNVRPMAEFYFSPNQPDPGETVSFHDLSYDVDGSIISWQWDFADGSYSSEPSP
ncbi:MAG TPA: PKD domain-containing protein, partial [Methanomassiliicoccales archaeon]|nr:PKD domain-containing protein [Methanomassiliicoccales archaeon]